MTGNSEFELLHPSVKKWVYKQGWDDLRDIQKQAIPHIIDGKSDVIISASTAAGKTEAAFLPACSKIADEGDGIGVLYISPLKALINDQYRRLGSLCELLDLPVTPWHGDSSQSLKKKCRQNPRGIILITPESLESLMIRDPGWLKSAFSSTQAIIIDEYHAFIGTDRGIQLQSLMHRLEHITSRLDKPIPRIALSATLGDMAQVESYLRPNQSFKCITLIGKDSHAALKLQLKGYQEEADVDIEDKDYQSATDRIAKDLFGVLRGESNLIFANSRQRTEIFASKLADLCEKENVPNEFFPHHGSLSKELRQSLEKRLQEDKLPTTAVCTMTLELGIDIGKVTSVVQVNAPHSVSSLRQRLGRSGRRDEPSILRVHIPENEITPQSHASDFLRMELFQCIAMIRLLIKEKWYESPDIGQYHFSTFVHQVLSIIAQWGGVQPGQIWSLLCGSMVFGNIDVEQFKEILRHLGQEEVINQLGDGQIVLGPIGENLVNHYTFYAVFSTPEEYRLEVNGKILGSLPVDSIIILEQHIVFGGRRWKVLDVDTDKKVIYLKAAKGGEPPKFGGSGLSVHDRVRQEMLELYRSGEHRIPAGNDYVSFLDPVARDLFSEGHAFFKEAGLAETPFIQNGDDLLIFTWQGDIVVNTICLLLIYQRYEASHYGGVIEVKNVDEPTVREEFKALLNKEPIAPVELVSSVADKLVDKFDELVPTKILSEGFACKATSVKDTYMYMRNLIFS